MSVSLRPSEIQDDVIRMICQYLNDSGFSCSKTTLMDEANYKLNERDAILNDSKRVKRAIMDGDWPEVDKICSHNIIKSQKSFLFHVYIVQFLEYIHAHELQKAFTHLSKRIKPLEHMQTTPTQYADLCYLLTAKNIQDSPSFKNWEGIHQSRESLCIKFQAMVDFEISDREKQTFVPPNRLLTLLEQAVSHQIESSRYKTKIPPRITNLLHDYVCPIIPNSVLNTFSGHTANVKCAEFVGSLGTSIISGSSDNTVRIWNTETGDLQGVLTGHKSRIWAVDSTNSGEFIASGSGDGSVKIWSSETQKLVSTLDGGGADTGDVYTVKYHPTGKQLVTGTYDNIVRLYDIERETVINTFRGHNLGISSCIFSPLGNLIISGSKDSTIKFFDIVSGLCIKTISSHLGEVTSVAMNASGTLLLSGSKDNSNRLFDVRTIRPIQRFKGHQNTSKNFVKCSFAVGDSLIVGGSEDGIIYIWDATGNCVQTLRGHDGAVYSASFNAKQSLFVSGSDDNSVKTWHFDP